MSLPTSIKVIKIVSKGEAAIKETPLPKPRAGYLLIRTTAVGLNPTDWKQVDLATERNVKLGCDYAGVVEEVASAVSNPFKKGDRVAGFAHGGNGSYPEDGAFGEYSVVKAGLAFKIPNHLKDEEAATLGLGIATIGQGLYQSLKLPLPTQPISVPEPILIYGGSTPTGLLGIQFAKLSGFTVVTTSSLKNIDYVRSTGADFVFDYSNADECLANIRNATGGKLRRAWDYVSTADTAVLCARALSSKEDSSYRSLLQVNPEVLRGVNPKVHVATTIAYTAFGERFEKWGGINEAKPQDYEFAKVFFEIAGDLLEAGKLKPVRQIVNHGGEGLGGVLEGLRDLKAGKVSAAKLVYKL